MHAGRRGAQPPFPPRPHRPGRHQRPGQAAGRGPRRADLALCREPRARDRHREGDGPTAGRGPHRDGSARGRQARGRPGPARAGHRGPGLLVARRGVRVQRGAGAPRRGRGDASALHGGADPGGRAPGQRPGCDPLRAGGDRPRPRPFLGPAPPLPEGRPVAHRRFRAVAGRRHLVGARDPPDDSPAGAGGTEEPLRPALHGNHRVPAGRGQEGAFRQCGAGAARRDPRGPILHTRATSSALRSRRAKAESSRGTRPRQPPRRRPRARPSRAAARRSATPTKA